MSILVINNPINHVADDVYSREINRFFSVEKNPYIIADVKFEMSISKLIEGGG